MRRRLNSRVFDPFDEWLESQGLYRKQVAKDGSCLFRAVAEQVGMTQTRHQAVRNRCLEYMMMYKDDFQPFLEEPIDHHVFKLQDVREWGGHTEILAMSRLYKRDFLIYQEIGMPPVRATENGFSRLIMLSFTQGNHYDIIYKKQDAVKRGFCQSIIYEILYSQVFQLKDVRLAVETMLHDKEYASLRRDSSNSTELKEIAALVEKISGTSISRENSQDDGDKNTSTDERTSVEEIHQDDVRGLLAHGIPPFPYKVAKSLDPDIYRNIEFDAWNTIRREARYGPFDSNGFQAGVKVYIKLDLLPNRKEIEKMRKVHTARQGNDSHDGKHDDDKGDVYHGHIQEMSENKGPVDVFIEEIGTRIKVPYESLEKVPPSPPRSPWHQQGRGTPGGGGGGGAVGGAVVPSAPSYTKLSGYYQKAPLPLEKEYSTGRSKKKGKQMREPPVNAGGGMRGGRMGGSPSPHTNSPRSRTPQGYHHQQQHNTYGANKYNQNRGTNNNYRNNHSSPAHDGFQAFPPGMSPEMPVDGVWTLRASALHGNVPHGSITVNSPMAGNTHRPTFCPALPPPPAPPPQLPPVSVPGPGDDSSGLQVQEVSQQVTLEALQQVMSAGGQQEVRVMGGRLEVVTLDKQDPQCDSEVVEHTNQFDDTSTPKAEERVNGTGISESCDDSKVDDCDHSLSPQIDNNSLQVEPLNPTPAMTTTNGEVLQASPVYQPESIAYITQPPPIPPPQLGCTPSGQMYTVTTCPPPYHSPGIVQVLSPMPQPDGQGSSSDFSPPSSTTSTIPQQSDAWDPNSQDPEALKMNQGIPPYMVYQVPVMYGGYGNYGYNQQWGIPIPVMQNPTMDPTKPPPPTSVAGGEGYPQMVAVSGWNPGYMGEVMQQPMPGHPPPHTAPQPPPMPPPQMYPPLLREPTPIPYPPLQQPQHDGRDGSRERPFYHNPRGRGRGGPHNFGHHRGNHHNSYNNFQGHGGQGMRGRGMGPPRPMPPRFQRGGGPGNRGGGPRHHQYQNSGVPQHYYPPHHHHHNPPHHHHHHNNPPHHRPTTQYEGQPLMQMGSRKSSSDSLASQVASGGTGSIGSSSIASPPLMSYMEPERGAPHQHALLPMPPPDTPGMPQQEGVPVPMPPEYYSAPPGYVFTGPWMWKMMYQSHQ